MPTIEELSAAFVKADAAGNTADAKVLADAIRQMQSQQPAAGPSPYAEGSVVLPPNYKNSYPGQLRALKYALRESFPESAFLGVLLGIGIYIVLWIPRLTLRAVRIVKAKPPVT